MPEYYYYIFMGAELFLTFMSFIFFRLKNKELKKVDSVKDKIIDKSIIFQRIPEFISEAEDLFGSGNGKAKLAYVLNKLNISFLENGLVFDKTAATEQIENILATPQKKEEV